MTLHILGQKEEVFQIILAIKRVSIVERKLLKNWEAMSGEPRISTVT